jgi:hypothetical protein
MGSVYVFSFVFIAMVTAEFVYSQERERAFSSDRSDVHQRLA